jgi:hypothetical protein
MAKLNIWRKHPVVLCNYTAANKLNKTQYQLGFSSVLVLFIFLLIQTGQDSLAIKDSVLSSVSAGHNPRNHTCLKEDYSVFVQAL